MTPLAVTAHLRGRISLPGGPLALDAMLASVVAMRAQLPHPSDELVPIEIPVEREPSGRFHLCSFSEAAFEDYSVQWVNRRFPIAEAQAFGEPRLKRLDITTGPAKSYRIPLETGHLEHDRLRWWCIGDAAQIEDLLSQVHYLGKKRAVGLGAVHRWTIAAAQLWDGFPVVRDGMPLRPLPVDWPGLSEEAPRTLRALTYPYWLHTARQVCAAPRGLG